jgi:autotransporter-associated beta strand protein
MSRVGNWINWKPRDGDSIEFSWLLTNRTNPLNDFEGYTFSGIFFNGRSPAIDLTGNDINLSGDIDNSSSESQSIDLNMKLLKNVNLYSGDGSDNLDLGGVISGGYGISKNGTSTLILGGANTYTGATTVSKGTLELGVAGAIPSSSAVTVSSGATLSLNTYNDTIASLSGSGTVNNNGATDATLTVGDATSKTFSGTLVNGGSGKLALTKQGSGTFTLTGANTYTGTTTINAGALNIQNASALGGTASGTSVASGAALQIQGGITTAAEALTLRGAGLSSDGALRNISGNNNYAGLVSLGSASRINSDSGTLTLSAGTITGATHGLTIGGAGNTQINSIIDTTSGALTKDGSGILTLAGTNTYTGVTKISAGTLSVATIGNGGVAGNLGKATSAAGNLVFDGGTLSYTGASAGTDRNFTIHAGKTATLDVTTNNLTISGAAAATTGALTKIGTGTLTFSGQNLYTGATTIDAGTLTLDYSGGDNSKISGSSALVLGGGTLTLSGGTYTQAVASTTLTAGNSSVTRSSGAAVLQMNDILVNEGATIKFSQAGIATTTRNNDASGKLGTWATIQNGAVTNWAMKDTDGFIVAFLGDIDIANYNSTILDGATSSVRINSEGTGVPALPIALQNTTTTIDSLFQDWTSAATVDTLGKIFRTNGILIGDGKAALTIGSAAEDGTLTSATPDGDIELTNESNVGLLTINAVIADNGGASALIKSGDGTIVLNGTNTYTGETFVAEGTLNLNQDLSASSGLVFGGSATVNLAEGVIVTPNITTDINDQGILNFAGSGSALGNAGASGFSLESVTLSGAGKTVNFGGNVYATTLSFVGDSTAVIASGKSIHGAVDNNSGTSSWGTLTLSGGNQSVAGIIGDTDELKAVNIQSGSGSTTTFLDKVQAQTLTMSGSGKAKFDGAITATALNITSTGEAEIHAVSGITTTTFTGAGLLDLHETLTGDITFGAGGDGTVTLLGGNDITGTVNNTSGSAHIGTLTLEAGGDSTISGAVGAANSLKAVNVQSDSGSAATFSAAVKAQTITMSGAGTVDFAGAVNATSVIVNSGGSLNLANASNAVTGDFVLTNARNVVIDNGTTAVNFAASGSAMTGDLTVTSGNASGITDSGTVEVAGSASFTTDANNGVINLDSLQVNGTLTLVTHGTGNATITNDENVDFGASNIGGALSATATTGNLTDAGTVTVGGNAAFATLEAEGDIDLGTLAVTGAISLNTAGTTGNATVVNTVGTTLAASTVGGNLDVSSSNNSLGINGALSTAAANGTVSLNAGTNTLTTGVGGTIDAGSGTVTLTADTMAIGAAISGTGDVTIKSATASQAINIGGGVGGLDLSTTELGLIAKHADRTFIFGDATAVTGYTGTMTLGAYDFGASSLTLNFASGLSGDAVFSGATQGTGALVITGSGTTTTFSADQTWASQTISDAVEIGGSALVTLEATAGGITINTPGTINQAASADAGLFLKATGDIQVDGAIGATSALGDGLNVASSAGSVTIDNIGGALAGVTDSTVISAATTLTLTGTAYNTDGFQDYTGAAGITVSNGGSSITFTTSADNVAFNNTLTLGNGSSLLVTTGGTAPGSGNISAGTIRGNSSEDVTLNASSANVTVGVIGSGNEINTVAITGANITLNGNITTDNTAGNSVTITGSATLGTDVTIDTSAGTGNISFTSTVNNGGNLLTINNTGASAATISGAISNAGGLTKAGTGTLTLSDNNTYTGATTVTEGVLELDFSAAGAPTDIIKNSSALVLSGGELLLTGKAGTSNSQTVNGLTLSAGNSEITLTATGGANPIVLNLGNIVNSTGTTINFTLPTGTQDATNGITTTRANDASGILGAWATVTTATGTEWAVKDAVGAAQGNIRAMSDVDYLNIPAYGGIILNDATDNVRIYTAGVPADGDITLAAVDTTINTLLQDSDTITATVDTAGGILRAYGIMISSGAESLVIGDVTGSVGTLTTASDGGDLVLSVQNPSSILTVNSIIANNGAASSLIKSGTGTVVLSGANTYTGATTVSEGTLELNTSLTESSGLSFSGAGTTVTVANGNDIGRTGNVVNITTTDNNQGTLTLAGTSTVFGTVGSSGLALSVINAGANGATATFSKNVFAAGLNVTGTGTAVLSGNFTGNINYNADGMVTLASDQSIAGVVDNATGSDGAGTLEFLGGAQSISGDIGSTHTLKLVDVASGTTTFNGHVNTTTLNLGTNSTAVLATDKSITGDVTAFHGKGTLTLAGGTQAITGDIGTASQSWLGTIDVGGSGTATFNGAIITKYFNVTGDRTVVFNDDVETLNDFTLSSDSIVTLADTKDMTLGSGGIAGGSGEGTLTLLGAHTITGNIGSTLPGNNGLKLLTVGNGAVTINGNVRAVTVNFAGDNELTLGDGYGVTGAVTTTTNNTGALTFSGATSTGGAIGASGKALRELNFNGATTLSNDIFATNTYIKAGSTVTMTGDATITGDLTLNNAANCVLDTGLNTLQLSGIYTQNANSTLKIKLSNTDYGRISASGVASVSGDSTLDIDVSGLLTGNTFKIIDSAAGSGLDVPHLVWDSPLFTITGSASGNDLYINVIRGTTYQAAALNSNAAAVGAALDNAPTLGDMATVQGQLDGLASRQEITSAMDSMHPDLSSGTLMASRQGASDFLGSISGRLGQLRGGSSGIATGGVVEEVGFWIQALGSHIKQDERKAIQGFQANALGTALGADKLLGDHFRAGFAGGYGYASVNSKAPGSPSDTINSMQVALYGSFDSINLEQAREKGKRSRVAVRNQGENAWYVDTMIGFAQNAYDSRRGIAFGTINRVAKAEHYGQQYSTGFESGYTFVFEKTKALEVTPFAGLGYNFMYMNSYKEKGADSINLSVDGQGYNQLLQTLGTKIAYPIQSKKLGEFIPAARAAWVYDYIGDQFQTTASFAGGGSSFTTQGAKPAKSGLLLGGELAFLNKGNVTMTANYDLELKDQFMSNTYYGTIRYDF